MKGEMDGESKGARAEMAEMATLYHKWNWNVLDDYLSNSLQTAAAAAAAAAAAKLVSH